MNFRRGLFRLWLLISFLWIALVVAVNYSSTSVPSLTKSCSWLLEFQVDENRKRLNQEELEACESVWREERLKIGAAAIIPPVIVLIFGTILAWVFAGFKANTGPRQDHF